MRHRSESADGRRISFTPAALKARHDGWTAGRQLRFIATLGATRSITAACAAVGLSRMSAYRLRGRPEAAHFALAWTAALAFDFAAPRPHSPRALQRLARIAARAAKARPERAEAGPAPGRPKGDETHETHDPPDSLISEPLARHLRHLRNLRRRAAAG